MSNLVILFKIKVIMYLKKQLSVIIIIFITLIVVSLFGCNKDKEQQEGDIPYVFVNFYLEPNTIDFIPANGWKYIDNEGYRGIVIYRINENTFNAYERTCPYDPQNDSARVEVDASGIILVDSCCMSKYNILDGFPIEGPSTLPLKQYFTEFDGNTLHVYNTP